MNDNAIYMVEIESRNRIVISKSKNATWEQVLELAKQNLKEVDTEQRELTPKMGRDAGEKIAKTDT